MHSPDIRVRKNIESLSEEELTRFRDAMAAIQALPPSDDRSFAWLAGQHGCSQQHCPHHIPGFFTWHRAYMNAIEMSLREFDDTVTHPYWQWDDPEINGLPKAYTDATYTTMDGKKAPNPLRNFTYTCGSRTDHTTTRNPGSLAQLRRIGADARTAMRDSATFGQLQDSGNPSIQDAHDGIHGWVGGGVGDMGTIAFAAYDPIFYAHHCNVDRMWAKWQSQHGNASMPPGELTNPLAPWPLKGEDVLDTKRQLHYRYAVGTAAARMPRMTARRLAMVADSGPQTRTIRFKEEDIGASRNSAEFQIRGMDFPIESVEVRLFVDERRADNETATEGNPNYAGSIYVFGHGECYGGEGHCTPREREPGDTRGHHHLEPIDRSLDVSTTLAATDSQTGDVRVTMVVVDYGNNLVDAGVLSYNEVALIARD